MWSPRLGATLQLTRDGRTTMRASYGRFTQGVLTGELEPFHPAATATTTRAFDPVTRTYATIVSIVDTLLDVRVSRAIRFAGARVELLLDLLNALNDTAEEGLATDNLYSPNFGRPTMLVEPRRAEFAVRFNLGR